MGARPAGGHDSTGLALLWEGQRPTRRRQWDGEGPRNHHVPSSAAGCTLISKRLKWKNKTFRMEGSTIRHQEISLSCCTCLCSELPFFHFLSLLLPSPLQLCTRRKAPRTKTYSFVYYHEHSRDHHPGQKTGHCQHPEAPPSASSQTLPQR